MDYIFTMDDDFFSSFNEEHVLKPINFSKKRALLSTTYTFISNLEYQTRKYGSKLRHIKSVNDLSSY